MTEVLAAREGIENLLVDIDLTGLDSASVFMNGEMVAKEHDAFAFATSLHDTTGWCGRNIVGGGVDLIPDSPLKIAFERGHAPLQPSLFNPNEHLVYGSGVQYADDSQRTAVLQLAFRKDKKVPDSETIHKIVKPLASEIFRMLQPVNSMLTKLTKRRLQYILEAKPPTSPNYLVMQFDKRDSQELRKREPGALLARVALARESMLKDLKAKNKEWKVLKGIGDGANYGLRLPGDIRPDPDAIAAFMEREIPDLKQKYPDFHIDYLPGYVTFPLANEKDQDPTGLVFYDLNDLKS